MKTSELISEADNPFDAIKELNVEFKALAADVDLTLVAGMGWPNITQKGGWFGGGLGQKGGSNKKNFDTLSLPIETRRKAFLHMLAKKLEGLMDEGRDVKIGQGASRSQHIENAEKGRVLDQLTKNLENASPPGGTRREKMPCVVWFVGLDSKMARTSTLYITAAFYGPPSSGSIYSGDKLRVHLGGVIDLATSKKLIAAFNKFKKANSHTRVWDSKLRSYTEVKASPKWLAFMQDMGEVCSRIVGQPLPKGFSSKDHDYFHIDKKVLPSSATRLTPAEMDLVISTLWKHFK